VRHRSDSHKPADPIPRRSGAELSCPKDQNPTDHLVQTEYGSDAWSQVIRAGFAECRIVSLEYPAALALVGVRA
jgi:hypothetical protein